MLRNKSFFFIQGSCNKKVVSASGRSTDDPIPTSRKIATGCVAARRAGVRRATSTAGQGPRHTRNGWHLRRNLKREVWSPLKQLYPGTPPYRGLPSFLRLFPTRHNSSKGNQELLPTLGEGFCHQVAPKENRPPLENLLFQVAESLQNIGKSKKGTCEDFSVLPFGRGAGQSSDFIILPQLEKED